MQARKRRVTRDWENEDPLLINNPDPVTPGQPEGVLQLEICHPVPCLSSKVDCVRYGPTLLLTGHTLINLYSQKIRQFGEESFKMNLSML